MYLPRHFEHGEGADLRRLIAAYPLATLVHQTESGADANHIPMRWREDDQRSLLVGHVARGNRLWREADGQPVLAIFHGPQAYVSPQWYPSKRVDGRAVPTWNYAVVHVRGRLRAIEDADWLYAFLDELSAAHETFQPRPWRINEAPADYLQKQLRAIVGIELTVEQIVGNGGQRYDLSLGAGAGATIAAYADGEFVEEIVAIDHRYVGSSIAVLIIALAFGSAVVGPRRSG